MATLSKLGAGTNFTAPMGEVGSIINAAPPPMPFTGAGDAVKPMADFLAMPTKMMGDISVQTSKLLSPIKNMNDAFASTLTSIFTSLTPQIANLTPQPSSPRT